MLKFQFCWHLSTDIFIYLFYYFLSFCFFNIFLKIRAVSPPAPCCPITQTDLCDLTPALLWRVPCSYYIPYSKRPIPLLKDFTFPLRNWWWSAVLIFYLILNLLCLVIILCVCKLSLQLDSFVLLRSGCWSRLLVSGLCYMPLYHLYRSWSWTPWCSLRAFNVTSRNKTTSKPSRLFQNKQDVCCLFIVSYHVVNMVSDACRHNHCHPCAKCVGVVS